MSSSFWTQTRCCSRKTEREIFSRTFKTFFSTNFPSIDSNNQTIPINQIMDQNLNETLQHFSIDFSNIQHARKKKSKGRDNQTNSVTVKSHEIPSDVQLPRGSAGGKTNDHPRHAAGPRIIQIFYTTGFTADIGVHRIPPRAWINGLTNEQSHFYARPDVPGDGSRRTSRQVFVELAVA